MADGFWFYAIILGGVFAQGCRDVALQVRARVRGEDARLFWPAVLWQCFLLLLTVEVFIAVMAYRAHPQPRPFLDFLAFLAIPVGISVASVLVESTAEANDSERGFARTRRVFFGIVIAIPLVNILHEALLGQAGFDVDLLFEGLIVAGGVIGLFLRRTWQDVVLASAMIAVVGAYIGVAYAWVTF